MAHREQHPPTGVPQYQQPEQAQAGQDPQQPQIVHVTRAPEPVLPPLTEEARKRHEESKARHPELNLSEGEYVISAIRRHPIGLISIWGVVAILVLAMLFVIPFYGANRAAIADIFLVPASVLPSTALVSLILLLIIALFALGGFIATVVYWGNRFYLTNESVTQHIQTSLFSKHEQTISLLNIEDASFRQHGILQYLLNYGSLRLSTQGEETTYRFNYVSNPRRQVALLNNAVEAFKSGRPVEETINNY